MNILVLNQTWFVHDLRKAGHTVISCGLSKHLDVYVESPLVHIETVIKGLPEEHKPDVILILDNSSPVMLAGIDETNIPIVFYSVDAHHHASLHSYLASVVDHTLVAQKDYIPIFEARGEKVDWMPLWASQFGEPSSEKEYGAVFVGSLNPKLNPDRVRFFDELQKKATILCKTGSFAEIFPKSEIVINQTVKGDLNFRVFESMMYGPMLLTERSGNGLFDIFEDGRHLISYEKGNVDEAAALIKKYLTDKETCRRIGAAGRQEILDKHLESHRSEQILKVLKNVKKRKTATKHLCAMTNYVALGRGMASVDTALAARAYLSAVRCGEQGIAAGEKLDDDLACYLVLACLRYDQHIKTGAGAELLYRAREANPDCGLVALACMRLLLNSGRRTQAEEIVRQIGCDDIYGTFMKAEEAISALLSDTI